jgi:hypothetical protein
MAKTQKTKEERLARLEKELGDLKAALPEHCYGSEGYISDHRATPAHWQKIEDVEEEIKKLKAELGR